MRSNNTSGNTICRLPSRRDALLRISKISIGDLRQDRTVDWSALTGLAYAENRQVRVIQDYLAKSKQIDGGVWATLVNLFGQHADELLFRALDRVEFSESTEGRFRTSLRCTDATKLSLEARRTFVAKWRAVLMQSDSAKLSTARAIEDLVRTCLLEGDEATAAVTSLRANLSELRTRSAEGAERMDSEKSTTARLIVDVWEHDLGSNKRAAAELKQFIKDPRLDAPDRRKPSATTP